MMKKILTSLMIFMGIAVAHNASATQLFAQVMRESVPINGEYIRETPVKSCRMSQVPVYGTQIVQNKASVFDKAAGALIGGVIGSHVGDGSGKDVATFLGAVVGAEMIENDIESTGRPEQVVTGYKEQEICEMVTRQTTVQEVIGYRTYIEFGEQIWQLKTPISYAKGEFIKVNVDISLAN